MQECRKRNLPMGREKEEKEEKAEMGKRGGGSAECEDAEKS